MAYSLRYSFDSTNQTYSVYGFSNITENDTVIIPDTYNDGTNGSHPVTLIKSLAFYNCSTLTSIEIGNNITSIGQRAFYECSNLKNVTIGNSVTSIGDSAFYKCGSLTSVTIPNSVTSIGPMAFYICRSLTSATIGNSVTSIGSNAFNNCNSLTSITIPGSVTSIGGGAFQNCSSLTSVTIGNSVTSIGPYVFANCSSLKQLILLPSTPPNLGSNAIPANVQSIYVPQSSKAAYQSATNWTTFASKIVSDNIYLSFVRFNQKNKEYIDGKVGELSTEVAPILSDYVDDALLGG